MINPVKIKDKTVGEVFPTFLIAEMACAHQGDVEQACKLIDVAVKAKADAVQIQVFMKELYMSPLNQNYDLISRLELAQEEWQKVIQPQSIETLEQYKRATRIGRGTRLGRADRIKVWPVFEEYRNLLTQNRKKEVDDAYRNVAALLAAGRRTLPYVAVLVDEAQDMSTQAFNLIRNLVPEGKNDLFIVGDGHQRIYGRNKVVLSHCGINIRGRSRKLKINYRTTEEIRKYAVGLLNGCQIDDLDGGIDDNKAFRSLTHGVPPLIE